MILHSQQALMFKNSEGGKFHIKNLEIASNAPEWIKETQTYKDAIEDGCLVVIEDQATKIAAENGELAKKAKPKAPKDGE